MKYINSIKSYYENNRKDKIIINMFFVLITLVFLFPFWGDLIFKEKSQDINQILALLFHLDILLTGPFTLLYMYMYTKIFNLSKIYFIYIILFGLNIFLSIFSILMSMESFIDLFMILPQLLSLLLAYYVSKKIVSDEERDLDRKYVYLSVLVPLILINIIGRLYFYLSNA